MGNLQPHHFLLPLGFGGLALIVLASLLKRPAGQMRLSAQRVTRVDISLAAAIAAAFYLIALWRLDTPTEAYFDECYHARTGMQYVLGQNPTEWTHPPVAKLLMAASLRVWHGAFDPREGIFQPSGPFTSPAVIGWRFPSVVAGSLSLLLLFALTRSLTRNRAVATVATLLLAVDGVFFVQSRIAMTNIFTVCFILAAVLGAWKYRRDGVRSWLLLMGLGLGCAIATRWTSIYAWGLLALFLLAGDLPRARKEPKALVLAALALALLATLIKIAGRFYQPEVLADWQRGHDALHLLAWATAGAAALFGAGHLVWHRRGPERLAGLPGWYVLAFFVIPIALYLVSYVPYMGQGHDFVKVFSEQKAMWDYHAQMKETHGYSSPWWSWPLLLRPAWYYFHSPPEGGTIAGIWCIGNAFLWWASVPALAVAGWLAWRDRRLAMGLPVLLGLGLWLPWGIQPRSLVFAHYYFESLPFACIALSWLCCLLWRRQRGEAGDGRLHARRALLAIGAFLVLGWWLLYYPVLSALPIPNAYFERLQWQNNRLWI
jgi:dolichyl-phosphate-mannose--protein O-mannosyl transferase